MKYIIIGAVAGGASTAARLRRLDEKAEIVIFEKGEHISYANCGLPYYIGNVIKDRNKLFVQTASSFQRRFNVDVRVNTEVTSINAARKSITATNLKTGEVYTERYDKLVLSPGASPVRPLLGGIEHEGIFTVRNVADTDYIKAYAEQVAAKRAVVIGAGFIGLEMAENLSELGMEVNVIEMAGQVLPPVDFPIAAIAQQHLRQKGLKLCLKTAAAGFTKDSAGLAVLLEGGGKLETDIVILSIGVKPDTRLAERAGLKLGPARGIQVNEFLQTSDPDIYAVGDAIEFPNPLSGQPTLTYLAGPANKQGRICANNIVSGNRHKYGGSVNSAIVKLFELNIGAVGMSVRQLQAAGLEHRVCTIHGNSHAGYYPGAQLMTIQIAFSSVDGQLLGAQVIGGKGVDKRLDILAGVIKNKGSVYDLGEFEHAYAPPFSSAKDPVNMAGFVAENVLLHGLSMFQVSEADHLAEAGALIDVRTPVEYQGGTIEGAVNIPLDEIRLRLDEIPSGKPLYIFCQQGMRGYLAQRILLQSGFTEVSNLSGGYHLYKTFSDELHNQQKECLCAQL